MLKVDTVKGTVWHRYNEDGYGEHEDGTLLMAQVKGGMALAYRGTCAL